jgi:hypothetical protein
MDIFKKGLLFGTESICMFAIYSLIPFTIEITSAAFLNVNLLTSDFYSVLVGIFLKNYKVYFIHVFCKFFKLKTKFLYQKILSSICHILLDLHAFYSEQFYTACQILLLNSQRHRHPLKISI